jgi:hypothetical protein
MSNFVNIAEGNARRAVFFPVTQAGTTFGTFLRYDSLSRG